MPQTWALVEIDALSPVACNESRQRVGRWLSLVGNVGFAGGNAFYLGREGLEPEGVDTPERPSRAAGTHCKMMTGAIKPPTTRRPAHALAPVAFDAAREPAELRRVGFENQSGRVR